MVARQDAKEPFDFTVAMRRLRAAVRPYPKAAMFELHDEGHTSVFEQLVACIISIRTLEAATLATARKLFAVARTPERVAALTVEQIDELIRGSTFHRPKAAHIRAIAHATIERHGGALPPDRDALMEFAGVGPKCANLAVGVATGLAAGIPVDIHVHRVTNRWGVVAAPTPEKTMPRLEQVLPKRYWLEINKLLVPFGKYVCRSPRPKCPHCPLLSMCRQVGVNAVDPTPPPDVGVASEPAAAD
ncbi:MAG TPA: hypothetical protein VD971_13040 [Phycisphaerales bacterium]|nr:hypothetical protein [Phycisphaerales bacterium]